MSRVLICVRPVAAVRNTGSSLFLVYAVCSLCKALFLSLPREIMRVCRHLTDNALVTPSAVLYLKQKARIAVAEHLLHCQTSGANSKPRPFPKAHFHNSLGDAAETGSIAREPAAV